MADILDLVEVQFVDQTNYVNIDNQDIMGCLFDFHWGPANQLLVLDQSAFYNYFPESIPIGANKVPYSKYEGYAQIKKAFNLGMSKVEVFRLAMTGKWKYQQVNLTSSAASGTQSDNQFNNQQTTFCSIATVYPGYVPQSLAIGYDNIAIRAKFVASTNMLTIEVLGAYDQNGTTQYAVLESFEGSIFDAQYDEGQLISIKNLVEASQFIRVQINESAAPATDEDFGTTVTPVEFTLFDPTSNTEYINPQDATENATIVSNISRYYDDYDESSSTLIIPPYSFKGSGVDNFDVLIQNIAARRKNVNAVIGYPVNEPFKIGNTTSDLAVLSYLSTLIKDKFSMFVLGREQINIFGSTIQINCTGGWCGATAKVAKEERINQLASARTYGDYAGVLTQSLPFSDVLELHDKYGVISVYNTKVGPQIFGVRTLYKKQTSYFGKANVMRVCANLLKNVYPVVLNALHTDVASEPTSMNNMEVSLQSIIDDLIANKNLRAESKVVCDKTVNTDVTTRGGTIFNVLFYCWFIGLTERIKIKIIATDSSVSAEITE